MGAKRDLTLYRKKVSCKMYYQIFINNLMCEFRKHYSEIFNTAKDMRIYRDEGKICFNPGSALVKSAKVIPSRYPQLMMLDGKTPHACYGKGTGDSVISATSHLQKGFSAFPNLSGGKRSHSLYNAYFDPELLRSIEANNFNMNNIFQDMGFNEDETFMRVTYRFGIANKLVNRDGGFIKFSTKGKEIVALRGTFNSHYIEFAHANRYPLKTQNEAERDL